MSKVVHFSIGQDFGKTLTTIAQEHILYSYNVQQGFKTIRESLIGIDDVTAFRILVGDLKLITDVETQSLSTIKNETDKGKLVFKNLYSKLKHTEGEAKKLERAFLKTVNEVKRFNKVDISLMALDSLFFKSNKQLALDEIENNFIDYKDFVNAVRRFIAEALKKLKVYKDLQKLDEKIGLGWDFGFNFKNGKPFKLEYGLYFQRLCNAVTTGDLSQVKEEVEEEKVSLNKYIEADKEITKVHKKGLEPVDHKQGWDAGYIAPDGTYYALNGEIANMLHLNLADAMLKEGIIPKEDENDNGASADNWLERNGWVKQHGNWILFDGYNNHKLGLKDKKLTAEQKQVIYEIGQICHGGRLKLGLKQQLVTAVMFKMIDDVMLKTKWFNW